MANNRFMAMNLNKSYGQHAGGPGNTAGRSKSGGHGGMLVLSRTRSQVAAQKAAKLAVPPPMNLPSLRREHGGGDPTVGQTTGSGSGSGVFGWSKLPSVNVSASSVISQSGDHGASVADTSMGRSNSNSVWAVQGQAQPGSNDSVNASVNMNRPNAYMPPAARSAALGNGAIPTVVEKSTSVLKGEDFPSLQAAMAPAPALQRPKEQKPRKYQEEKGQTSQMQGLSDEQQAADDRDFEEGAVQPQLRPRQPTSLSKENDGSDEQQFRKADRYSFAPPLVRLNHTSNWADDERDTGRNLPQEHDRSYESFNYDHPRFRGNNSFSNSFRERSEIDYRGVFRDDRRGVAFDRERNFGSNTSPDKDRGVSKYGNTSRESSRGASNVRNGGKTRESDYNRDTLPTKDLYGNAISRDYGSRESKYDGHRQEGQFGIGGRDIVGKRVTVQSTMNRRYNDVPQSNAWNRSSFSTSTKGTILDDPILDFGREKRSSFKYGKQYTDDPFMKEFASFSGFDFKDPLRVPVGAEIKLSRRKKDDSKLTNFYDPIRESFEAELERVQRMQEQERQRMIEEQERAKELARKEEEERQRQAREEEERQRRLEQEAREAAWRAEQEAMEAARRLEEERRAREDEKRRIIQEEERRKEAARRKLRELEEKMAKRQAEEAKLQDNGIPVMGKPINDKDTMRRADRGDWEEEERMIDRIASSASSESSNPSRPFEAGIRLPLTTDAGTFAFDRAKSVSGRLSRGSHILAAEHNNSYNHTSLRDSFKNRSYPSNTGKSEVMQINDHTFHRNYQRWVPDDDFLQFSRVSDMDSELIGQRTEGFGESKWGQERHDSWRLRDRIGVPVAGSYYSQIAEVEDFSFGRSRHSVKQPRVLPPPSIAVIPKEIVKDKSSYLLDEDTRRNCSNVADIKTKDQDVVDKASEDHLQVLQDKHSFEDAHENNIALPPSSPLFDTQEDETFHYKKNEDITTVTPNYDVDRFNDVAESFSNLVEQVQHDLEEPKSLDQNKHEEWVIEDENDFGDEDEDEEEEEEMDQLYENEVIYEEKEDLEVNVENVVFQREEQKIESENDEDEHTNVLETAASEKHIPDTLEQIVDTNNSVNLYGDNDISATTDLASDDQFSSAANQNPSVANKNQSEVMESISDSRECLSDVEPEIIQNPGASLHSGDADFHNSLTPAVESLEASDDSLKPSAESSQQSGPLCSLTVSHPSTSAATSAVPSMVSPVQTIPNQSEFPIKLQFGLFPGHSVLPATVPAIQIGSIQMPLQLHPQVPPSLTQIPPTQPPLFSLGQVRFPASMSQGILPIGQPAMPFMHPTVSPHFSLGQSQSQLSLSNHQVLESPHQQSSLIDAPQKPTQMTADTTGVTATDASQHSKDHLFTSNRTVGNMNNQPIVNTKNQPAGNNSGIQNTEQKYKQQSLFVANEHINFWSPSEMDSSALRQMKTGFSDTQNSYSNEQPKNGSISGNIASQHGETVGVAKGSKTFQARMPAMPGQSGNMSSGTWSHIPNNNKLRRQSRRNSRRNDFRTSNERRHSDAMHRKTDRHLDAGEYDTYKGAKKDVVSQIDGKAEKPAGSKSVKNGLHTSRDSSSQYSGRLHGQHGKVEVVDEASLHSGVVRIYKQSGIETPSDVDDFIEVRSKRQMLNDRREQREKEIKAKTKDHKIKDQAKKQQRSFGKVSTQGDINPSIPHWSVVSPGREKRISSVSSNVNVEAADSNGRVASNGSSSGSFGVSSGTQPLAPIGTPVDGGNEKRSSSWKPIHSNSISVSGVSHVDIDAKNSGIYENLPVSQDNISSTSVGAWGSNRSSQQVVSLTQIQLEEAMKPPNFESKHAPLLPLGECSGMALEPGLTMPPILAQEKLLSAGAVPLSPFLNGEKIQFGAVTPSTLLAPVGSSSSTPAVSSGLATSMSCRADVCLESSLPTTETESTRFFNKSEDRCRQIIDADAEAEAAASAVAVAAITTDESTGSGGLGGIVMSSAEIKVFGTSDMCVSSVGVSSSRPTESQPRSEDSMAAALPADLSVENPPLSLWSSVPNRQGSGPVHPHFSATPSHFPCFEVGPMLGSPIFAFGQPEEASSLSQGQKCSTSVDQGLCGMGGAPVGGWQQCHSSVDSFYGAPPSGFPSPYISPPAGIPGIQAPPHMFVYTNPFAPVGQFGPLGLSFMGTYIPSGKQPDWKHTPVSTSGGPVNEGDMGNIGMIAAQRNSGISNAVQQISSGSSVMPVVPHHGLFEMNLSAPFQSSADLQMQSQWSHIPSLPLHSMPVTSSIVSLSTPNEQADNLSAQLSDPTLTVQSGGNRFHQVHGVKSGGSSPFTSIDAAAQFPDELGLGDSVANSSSSVLSGHVPNNRTNYNCGPSNMKVQKGKNLPRGRSNSIGSTNEGSDLVVSTNNSSASSNHGNRTVGSHLQSQSIQQTGPGQYPHPIGHQSTGHKSGGAHEWSGHGHGHGHRKIGGQGRSQISGDKNFTTKMKQVYVVKPSSSSSSRPATLL